jgi:ribose/xylose/arabinose/galactoside ABC-type transport system permease subunit
MNLVQMTGPTLQKQGYAMKAGLKIPRLKETGLLGVMIALALALTLFGGSLKIPEPHTGSIQTVNKFLRADNLSILANNASFFAIMAIGEAFVIITGGIDLSVGAIYCLSAVSGAMFLSYFGPAGLGASHSALWVVPAAIFLCISVGTLCGFLNGAGIVWLRIHPFVVTLGTMAIYRGVAFVMTKAQAFTNFPASFTDGLIRRPFMWHAHAVYLVPLIIMVCITIFAGWYLKHTVTGRHLFAVGGNEQAALFSGLPVGKLKLKVYAFSGMTAGIAAVIMLGYYGSASSEAGSGYELEVIAAAVVGGASLAGGRGTALGALLGALIIQMIGNGIIILNIDQNYSQIIIGLVIILAVLWDRINSAMREKRMAGAAQSAKPLPASSD